MGDEDLYRTIAAELSSGRTDPVLWTKALADADGDQDRTKAHYIRLRFAALRRAQEELARTSESSCAEHVAGELAFMRRELDAACRGGKLHSFYQLIGISPLASDGEVTQAIAAYQAKVDDGTATASPEFKYAREMLGSAAAREAYDRKLHANLHERTGQSTAPTTTALGDALPADTMRSWMSSRKLTFLVGLLAFLSVGYLLKGVSRDVNEQAILKERVATEQEIVRAARESALQQAEISRLAIEKRDAMMERAFGRADQEQRDTQLFLEREADRRRQEYAERERRQQQRLELQRERQKELAARRQEQARQEADWAAQQEAERQRRYWACMNAELDRTDSAAAYQRCANYR